MSQIENGVGRHERVLAVALVFCALFFSFGALFSWSGAALTVSLILFSGVFFFYLRYSGSLQRPLAFLLFPISLLFSLSFLLFDGPLPFFSLIALCVVSMTTFYLAAGYKGSYRQLFLFPFSYFNRGFAALGSLFKSGSLGRGVALSLLSLLAVIPLLLVLGVLLSFDTAFGALSDFVLGKISFNAIELLPKLFCAVLIFLLSFSFVYALSHRPEKIIRPERSRFGNIVLVSVLTPVLLLYLIFFLSQLLYFLDLSHSILPADFSYADYARSGFFNLVAIAVINLGLVLLIRLCVKRGRTAQIYSLLLSIATLPFLFLSLLKMKMYIGKFALTPLRVYVTVFIVALFLFFLILIISIFWKNVQLFPAALILSCLVLLSLTYGRCDKYIARYNIELALQTNTALDWELLSRLSDDAVPEFFRLSGTGMKSYYYSYDEEQTDTLELLLDLRSVQLAAGDQTDGWNFDELRAKELIPDYLERAERFQQQVASPPADFALTEEEAPPLPPEGEADEIIPVQHQLEVPIYEVSVLK